MIFQYLLGLLIMTSGFILSFIVIRNEYDLSIAYIGIPCVIIGALLCIFAPRKKNIE